MYNLGVGFPAVMRSGRFGGLRIPSVHGKLGNGSKINGLDFARTAISSPSVNSVPARRSLSTLASNLDCQPNHWLKNVRIVFSYFAENALKHRSRSSRQVDTRSSPRTSH
jgi:hypothetical protein